MNKNLTPIFFIIFVKKQKKNQNDEKTQDCKNKDNEGNSLKPQNSKIGVSQPNYNKFTSKQKSDLSPKTTKW